MKKILAYCLPALLTLLSCTREPGPYAEIGNTVSIHLSTAGMIETRAVTPGDGQGGDGGGFPDYYMSFEAPAEGTLTVTASSTDGSNHDDYKVGVLVDGAVIASQKGGYTSSQDVEFAGLEQGTILIYPVGGPLRFYQIQFDYLGDDPSTTGVIETDHPLSITWDFSAASFYGQLAAVNLLDPYTRDAARTWMANVSDLTIWSKGNSTWSSGGYFEWGGYYTDPELVILIANASSIVAKYPTTGSLEQHTLTDAEVKFTGLASGEYTVYAFGNTGGFWKMDGQGVSESAQDFLLGLTTKAQVESLKFAAKTNYMQNYTQLSDLDNEVAGEGKIDPAHPWDDGMEVNEHGLPVSARAPLTVSASLANGEAYLELQRCVAKVTAVIVNNTGEGMTLYDYRHVVRKINHTAGWVLPQDEDVTGAVGHLAAYPNKKYYSVMPSGVPIPISEKGSRRYDWYVFPSDGPYTIDIGFTLYKGTVKEHPYIYTDLPVTNWKAENITSLGRNQHLTVTTRVSKGLTVSFNFQVEPWETDTATVEFD